MGQVHVDLALDEPGLAGGAYAVLAGVGQVHALVQAGVEDVLADGGELELQGTPVGDDGDPALLFLAEGALALARLFQRGLGILAGAGEEFVVNLVLAEARGAEAAGDFGHHRLRPADEGLVGVQHIDQPGLVQGRALFVVDTAIEQVAALVFLVHDVDPLETVEVAVLHEGEIITEHHAAGLAVAVDQRHPAFGLACQHSLDDRQDRRDAAAGGDAHVVELVFGIDIRREMPLRRQGFDDIADLQTIVGPVGEFSAGHALDADLQAAIILSRTDGIAAADRLAIDLGAQRQVLPGAETKDILLSGGRLQGQAHGFVGFRAQLGYGQGIMG